MLLFFERMVATMNIISITNTKKVTLREIITNESVFFFLLSFCLYIH